VQHAEILVAYVVVDDVPGSDQQTVPDGNERALLAAPRGCRWYSARQ
jgi:hypothetical protein